MFHFLVSVMLLSCISLSGIGCAVAEPEFATDKAVTTDNQIQILQQVYNAVADTELPKVASDHSGRHRPSKLADRLMLGPTLALQLKDAFLPGDNLLTVATENGDMALLQQGPDGKPRRLSLVVVTQLKGKPLILREFTSKGGEPLIRTDPKKTKDGVCSENREVVDGAIGLGAYLGSELVENFVSLSGSDLICKLVGRSEKICRFIAALSSKALIHFSAQRLAREELSSLACETSQQDTLCTSGLVSWGPGTKMNYWITPDTKKQGLRLAVIQHKEGKSPQLIFGDSVDIRLTQKPSEQLWESKNADITIKKTSTNSRIELTLTHISQGNTVNAAPIYCF